MSTTIITHATIQDFQEIVKELGWQADLAGTKEQPQLISTVNGVNFNVRVGTRAAGSAGWSDFTISAQFRVDQEISPVVGSFWNRRNRFARVYRSGDQLFLDMDVVLGGGVTRNHIKYLFAIWSDVSRLFVQHLRADHAVLARYKASRERPGVSAEKRPAAGNGAAGGTSSAKRQATMKPVTPASENGGDVGSEKVRTDAAVPS